MTFPWEINKPPLDLTEDENGIPAFLKRVRMPDGSVQIGVNPSSSPPASARPSLPPWASNC
jgi:hypothetical protein